MKRNVLLLDRISAVLYGEPSDRVWLFVHGKCGCKEEGAAFGEIVCPKGAQVLAIDLPEHGARKEESGFVPWQVVPELRGVMAYLRGRWGRISLRSNSIGAWFSLLALADMPPEQALLVSPVLDMEQLIRNRWVWPWSTRRSWSGRARAPLISARRSPGGICNTSGPTPSRNGTPPPRSYTPGGTP